MTDGFHKSGMKAQIKIFFILVHVTTQNMVILVLFRSSIPSLRTNHKTNQIVNIYTTTSLKNYPSLFQMSTKHILSRR